MAGRPPIRDGERSVIVRTRLEESLWRELVDEAEARGLTVAAFVRAIIRQRLTVPAPVPIDRARRNRRSNPARVPLPDPAEFPIAFLSALRDPAPGVHDYVKQVSGPPVCATCGATPAEEAPCRR